MKQECRDDCALRMIPNDVDPDCDDSCSIREIPVWLRLIENEAYDAYTESTLTEKIKEMSDNLEVISSRLDSIDDSICKGVLHLEQNLIFPDNDGIASAIEDVKDILDERL